jgi:EpsI family protein
MCNWVRVFTVVLAGQLTDMQSYLVRVDHYWFGWLLFGVAMMGFIWFTGRGRAAADTAPSPPASQSGAINARPVYVAAVLLAAFPVSQWLVRVAADQDEFVSRDLPAGKGGWTGPYSAAQDWRPLFHGATSEVLASYRDRDARAVEVYAVVYLGQRQGAELVGYGNSLLGERGFEQHGESVIATPNGKVIETIATDAAGRKSIIWSVYDIGGRAFVEPLRSQLWYGVTALSGRPVASLAAARAVCVPDCDGAREKLERFFDQMGPQLRATKTTGEG